MNQISLNAFAEKRYFKEVPIGLIDAGLEWCYKAIHFNPTRAEAYNEIGLYFFKREEWSKAIPFFQMALTCEKPKIDPEFVYDSHYSWLPHEYIAFCFSNTGNFKKALEHAVLSLKPDHPCPENTTKNMHIFVDKIVEASAN